METNNFGALDYKEFQAQMDLAGELAYKENYESEKYTRTAFEVEEYMLSNMEGQQFKLMRYIIYKCYRSPSFNSLWMKETVGEIASNLKMDPKTVKRHLKKFEDAKIIKRYKRHPRDKQHIVLMATKFWEPFSPPSK
ncbi:winged helix-turn-helix domain-containing protein [Bacillus licheniformis]|uniref:winged helix-turn-helix domain-containing protein n=1 Tax=Bacillus licheniformis TaxID=1402 RepID=UPI0008FB3247|nr:winged helix-turn-helix domain-containing protein [Bacillus licheniformis]OIS80685.1 hypothetical protein A4A43_09785 [Bacillus licheniformis]OIS82267.1 hypothetical protein A4A38_05745 [Bacillus licheniformis]OIS84517.1 hypothetical protein A4A42_20655 [Bacillus licheniformis]OIS86295.1 hypothetical protein A4A40_21085 [Bacillus licheniformis]WCO63671.1 winged helix-turn-helix domain-containing protein [Bacillus licheniformis]